MVAALLLAFATTGAGAAAPAELLPRHVSVPGQGEVRVAPDEVSFSLGIWKESPDAAKARQAMSLVARRVIAALKRNGVAKKDIRTAQVSLRAQYRHDRGKRTLTGYRASTSVTVRARELDSYDRLIAAAMEAGATELSGVVLSHSRLDDLEKKARRAAVEDARDKARLLATAAGAKLGRIHSIEESSVSRPRPLRAARGAELAAAGPANEPSLAGGEIVITVRVRTLWELAD